jgi:hypothetical protein
MKPCLNPDYCGAADWESVCENCREEARKLDPVLVAAPPRALHLVWDSDPDAGGMEIPEPPLLRALQQADGPRHELRHGSQAAPGRPPMRLWNWLVSWFRFQPPVQRMSETWRTEQGNARR